MAAVVFFFFFFYLSSVLGASHSYPLPLDQGPLHSHQEPLTQLL